MAKSTRGKNQPELPIDETGNQEENPQQTTQEGVNPNAELPTQDDLIKKEVAKYDEIIPKVDELKKQYLPMVINGIGDLEGYKAVTEALKFIVGKRTAIEAKRKELKEFSLKVGRAIDNRAKEITEMIAPIEDHLKSEKKKVDDEAEAIRLAKQQEQERKMQERFEKLTSLGCRYDMFNNSFEWHEREGIAAESFHEVNIEVMEDEEFENTLFALVQKNNMADTRKKEREEKEEAERQEQERKRQEMEAENQRLQKEQEEIKKQLFEVRETMLTIKYGLVKVPSTANDGGNVFIFRDNEENISYRIVTEETVKTLSYEQWNSRLLSIENEIQTCKEKVAEIKQRREEQKKKDEEAAEQRRIQAEEAAKHDYRYKRMFDIGLTLTGQDHATFVYKDVNFHWTDLVAMTDEEFDAAVAGAIKRIAEIKAQEEQQRKEAEEQERLNNLSDKEKMIEYVEALFAVPVPELKGRGFKSALNSAVIYIKNLKQTYGKLSKV